MISPLFWNTLARLVPHRLFAVSCAWKLPPRYLTSFKYLLKGLSSQRSPPTPPFYITNYLPSPSLYRSSSVPLRKCKLHKTSDPRLFYLMRKTTKHMPSVCSPKEGAETGHGQLNRRRVLLDVSGMVQKSSRKMMNFALIKTGIHLLRSPHQAKLWSPFGSKSKLPKRVLIGSHWSSAWPLAREGWATWGTILSKLAPPGERTFLSLKSVSCYFLKGEWIISKHNRQPLQ